MESLGVEPTLFEQQQGPPCHSGVFPLDYDPVNVEWTAGELNPDFLVASQASCHWTSSPKLLRELLSERSVRELNPIFRLTTAACCQYTYRPLSDPGWS